jgi:hypothetical protein
MDDADWTQGASDPGTRLKGEILGSFADWANEYGQTRLELPWTVAQMLLKHVGRTQDLAVYLEFIERLSAILGDEAAALRQVIAENFRKRAN